MIPPSRHSSKFRRKPHPGIADLVVPRSLGRVSAKLASGKQSEKKGKPMMGPTMKSIFGEKIRLASF